LLEFIFETLVFIDKVLNLSVEVLDFKVVPPPLLEDLFVLVVFVNLIQSQGSLELDKGGFILLLEIAQVPANNLAIIVLSITDQLSKA